MLRIVVDWAPGRKLQFMNPQSCLSPALRKIPVGQKSVMMVMELQISFNCK